MLTAGPGAYSRRRTRSAARRGVVLPSPDERTSVRVVVGIVEDLNDYHDGAEMRARSRRFGGRYLDGDGKLCHSWSSYRHVTS
jgi:hypothetical protein